MKSIHEYISIKKLNKEKDTKALEQGHGCIFSKNGALSAYYYNGSPMCYLAYITFLPHTPRGGHLHKTKEENMFIVSGSLKARYWLLSKPEEVLEVLLEQGEIVNIKPGCAHLYYSETGAVALEFSPQKFVEADCLDVGLKWL